MPSKDIHIHKFKRLKFKSGNTIFFCALPDCNKKLNVSLALGKRSLCWRCGEPFVMTEYSLRLVKPHCENCHKSKVDNNNSSEAITESIKVNDDIIKTLSLSEQLEQTIQQAQKTTNEDEI